LGYLTFDDKSGVHDLYLDGIWFVQGLISDFRYQSLPLPPPSNTTQEQYSLPGVMRVHGKGMIATVEGTEISLGGVVEAGDESATQLSVVVAPTRILFNLLNIFRTNPELIPPGMTLSGNINVTDRPAQASVCTPMGGIVFQDDPTWNRQAAEATYGKNAPYDRFYIIGNLIVNQLNQEQMESKATNGRSLGGGVVRYDNHLIEDSFGQADNKNYHVTIGQRFSYYDITVVNDDLKEDGRVN
jgi:hypothetical protein